MRVLRLAALLAACTVGAAAQVARPLEASLRHGTSEPSFFVDQPAYVAVFEVIPGQGVQQLFPRTTSQAAKPVEPGEYLLSRPFRSQYRYYGWNYAMPYARPMWMVDNQGRIISYYYTTGWTGTEAGWGASSLAPTRTLLLVASRRPLRQVGSPDAAQHWLQQALGFRAISSTVIAPDAFLTDIVDAIMPLGSTVDDIVVDVLEVTDHYNAYNRYAGQSIAFYCPTGMYNIPADYFFATGMFYCPIRHYYDSPGSTPTGTPGGGDTVTTEKLQLPARKVPSKSIVEEQAVPLRRGVVATPVNPSMLPEEGYRPYRPSGGESEEGFKSFARGVRTTGVGPQGTIAVGVPVDPTGLQRGNVTPASEAFVPWIVRSVPTEGVSGARRANSGGWTTGTAGGTGSPQYGNNASSTGSAAASASSPAAASAASQAQAERSAASREAVSAARPASTTKDP